MDSINTERSYTEYDVSEPTTDFAIGFDNYSGEDKDAIHVTLDGVNLDNLDYTVVRKNAQTIEVTPAIESGVVRLQRETYIDQAFHTFTAGALFSPKSMDENFAQVRRSQQEVNDGFTFLAENTNGVVAAADAATARANAAAELAENTDVSQLQLELSTQQLALDAQKLDTGITATAKFGGVKRTQAEKNTDLITVKDFGAKGDDDQTLYTANYQSDRVSQPSTITQQTKDGLAFNKAIRYLRNKGGGALYIPEGVYRVYGYLERIDFPCVIYGAGSSSLIKNCDNSPTDRNGYGVFHIEPEFVSEITFMNLKVDGNGHTRTKPTLEWRSYNFHVCGKPQLRMLNVTSVNATIDCFTTRYTRPFEMDGDDILWCKLINCHFEDAYRNTLSLVAGNNIDFVNCTIMGGGYVHGGTNPRFCLDIEPTTGSARTHVRNVTFTNCTFARAINVIIGGTWGQCTFNACTIDASHKHAANADKLGYPWAISLSSLGDWYLNSCKVIGNKVDKSTICTHYNAYDTISDFAENGGLQINATDFQYCGFTGNGRKLSFSNVEFKNSLRPISIKKGSAVPQGDLRVRDLRLVNVFENTLGSGSSSSFVINVYHNGVIDIDGLSTTVDKTLLLKEFVAEDFTRTAYHGITVDRALASSANNGLLAVAKNVHSEGYYKRINDAFNLTKTARDWEKPNLPPADSKIISTTVTATLTDGAVVENVVTNKAVTGTGLQKDQPQDRVLGGRTTGYYQNCTMWGDYE